MHITTRSTVHKINEDLGSLMNRIPIDKKLQIRCKINLGNHCTGSQLYFTKRSQKNRI